MPNCKDACSTYYEGINRPAEEISEEESEEIKRKYNLEQQQRYYERNYRRNMRLGNGCLDQHEASKYFGRASQYKNMLIELCDNNPDALRLDKARLSLRGVLSVDNVGRLSIMPTAKKKPEISHTDAYNAIMDRIKAINERTGGAIVHKKVELLKKKLTDAEIIEKIGGGDLTKGSCSSLAFAYTGNKNGLDVTDFRGGQSQEFFATNGHIENIVNLDGVKSQIIKVKKEAFETAKIIKELPLDKEYYLSVGKHAAIIKNTDKGVMYLELQSSKENGWKYFAVNGRTTSETLIKRFGARKTEDKMKIAGKTVTFEKSVVLAEVDSFKDNDEFREILGYINTASDKQKKGANGFAK